MFCATTRPRLLSTHLSAPVAPRWSRLPERKNAHRGLAASAKPVSAPTRSQVSIASGENSRCCTKARRTPLLPQGNPVTPSPNLVDTAQGDQPVSEVTVTGTSTSAVTQDPNAYTYQLDEIVVQGTRVGSLGGVHIDFRIPYPQEQIWTIYGYDMNYLGSNNGTANGNIGKNKVTIPSGFTAIVHTHPSWAEYGPGPADFGLTVPLFGIAPSGVWLIMPGATAPIVLYGAPLN